MKDPIKHIVGKAQDFNLQPSEKRQVLDEVLSFMDKNTVKSPYFFFFQHKYMSMAVLLLLIVGSGALLSKNPANLNPEPESDSLSRMQPALMQIEQASTLSKVSNSPAPAPTNQVMASFSIKAEDTNRASTSTGMMEKKRSPQSIKLISNKFEFKRRGNSMSFYDDMHRGDNSNKKRR